MTQPGIPNQFVLSTSCFGPRLRKIEDQAFSAVAMGFRALELGLSATPSDLLNFEDASRETGITVDAVVVGALKPMTPDMSGTKLGSADPDNREMALNSVRRHIRAAHQLGANTVIVRANSVEDGKLRTKAADLLEKGLGIDADGREDFGEELRKFVEKLQQRGQKQIEHLCRALHTLRKEFPGTRIAIEPGEKLDDLLGFTATGWVLEDLDDPYVGYWHSTARCYSRESKGLIDQGQWLDAYASKMFGVHLTDATEEESGLPPGLGAVDFRLVAEYCSTATLRVVDVHPHHGRAEVLGSVSYLIGVGF